MGQVVILLGAPGAGKGTQALRLSRSLALPHVSTGNLFREHIANGTELGRRAGEFMDGGRLVPDDLVLDMLFAYVDREPYRAGYLLDGFPRTLAQARNLDERLARGDEIKVVMLEVPDEVIVARAGGRLVCSACSNIHHQTFSPPRTAGVCDACGGELRQRDDDRPEVVRRRLAVYGEETQPVVDYYRGQGRLCVVNGDQDPSQVFEACLACVR
jgi:adenylate kinase